MMDEQLRFVDRGQSDITANSIQYLNNISTLKELKVPVLQTFYNTQRRLLECRNKIVLHHRLTDPKVSCQRCFAAFENGPASYRIKARKKLGRFSKKTLRKYYKGGLDKLTKFQQKHIRITLKRQLHMAHNKLEITCKFCKKQKCIPFSAPIKPTNKTDKQTPAIKTRKSKATRKTKVAIQPKTAATVAEVTKEVQAIAKSNKIDRKTTQLLKQLGNILNSSPKPNKSSANLGDLLHTAKK